MQQPVANRWRPFVLSLAILLAMAGLWLGWDEDGPPLIGGDPEPMIKRAIMAEGRLWMMDEKGGLQALGPRAGEPVRVKAPGKLLEMCMAQGQLVALVETDKRHWRLWRHRPAGTGTGTGSWTAGLTIPAVDEKVAALGCAADRPEMAIITERRLLELDGRAVRAVPLLEPLPRPLGIGTLLFAGDRLWLALNAGGAGGGLRLLDRKSGTIISLESDPAGPYCRGTLDQECDAVTGIVPSLTNPGCVIAAVGFKHRERRHGRLVEACATRLRRLYEQRIEPQPDPDETPFGEPLRSVPFFGLKRIGTTLWAVSLDALYRFDGNGPPQRVPLPEPVTHGKHQLVTAGPGLVLLLPYGTENTGKNRAMPILAAP